MSRQADSTRRNAGEKPVNGSRTVAGEPVWRGYINVNLSVDQKGQYEAWSATNEVWDTLQESVSDGCHIGLKWVGKEKVFLASLTQRTPGHVNEGLCVTARASTADKALFRVLFLYRVLGGTENWEKVQPPADPDRW